MLRTYVFITVPPVQGNWTEWTEWSECSAKCNGGIQTRRRSCKEPPAVKVIPCAGSTQEWRMCNTHICEGNLLKISNI